ncbi:hypothetical protein FQZ97_1189000 [compost metagenome]
MLALGQVHHGIGALATLFGGDADFALVVLAQLQARAVEYVFQHQLAPIALQLLLATQRGGQLMGLGGDLLVQRFQLFQLFAQLTLLGGFAVVDLLHFALEGVDGLLERRHHGTQAELAALL